MKPPRSRPRVDDELVSHAASRLTDRDGRICELLYEHRVLTTDQLAAIAFGTGPRARHRILDLYRLRVVDRFRPVRPGVNTPYHYVLDEIGAEIVASRRGCTVPDLGWRRERAIRLASSQRLDHLVGVNGFFATLIATSRRTPGAQLTEWWSERRCAAEWGDVVRPDGYGVWTQDGTQVSFFLEHDCGTETIDRVVAKLDGYRILLTATGSDTWVLLDLPNIRRERDVRRAASEFSGLRVATATRSEFTGVRTGWLGLDAQERCPLALLRAPLGVARTL